MQNGESRIDRRSFVLSGAAFAMLQGCGTRSGVCRGIGAKRWYKGNLHAHTFWSDGNAFPEEAVAWYKGHGYNFLGLSDHNIFQDESDSWITAIRDGEKNFRPEWFKNKTHRWIFTARQKYIDAYLRAFPDAQTRTSPDGRVEARLKTFDELSAMFNAPGEFLLLPDVEATRAVDYSDGRFHQLHMNYVNLPRLLPLFSASGYRRVEKDVSISSFLRDHEKDAAALARSLGRSHLFILNHPIWTWYDVGPEAMIDVPDVRFFELCNNGSPYAPGEGLPTDGLDTDRLWDVVNAFRARRGQPLLYGIGTDDTHNYHGEQCKMLMPGNAWSLVRSASLDAASLIEAMYAGDFVTCEGLEIEDVSFDASSSRLEVAVPAGAAPRTVRFIVTKRDFSEKPVATMTVRPGKFKDVPKFQRIVNIYDEKIGKVVKTVTASAGEPIRASYTLSDDDLYVRARVEERGTPLCSAPLHPQGLHVAWTQPYSCGA